MRKLTATLEAAQGFSILEKDNYPGHIHNVQSQVRESFEGAFRDILPDEDVSRYLADRGAIMLKVQWKPEGEKAGEFIGTIFDNVMVAGVSGAKAKTNPGATLSTNRLCDYINALGVPYDCQVCGQTSTKKFVIEKGKYFCPNCGKPAKFDFDPETWTGKRAMLSVSVGADNKGEPRNEIDKVRPLA
jgi:hypothetical protein